MPLSKDQIVPALVQLVGESSVVSEAGDMAGYVSEPRRRFHKQAQAVVLPRTVAEVQAVMEWANEVGVHIIPQAGNTGLVGGQVPLFGDEVIVSISKLKGVRNVDAAAGQRRGQPVAEALDVRQFGHARGIPAATRSTRRASSA